MEERPQKKLKPSHEGHEFEAWDQVFDHENFPQIDGNEMEPYNPYNDEYGDWDEIFEPYYPNHDEFGAWDQIFEQEIFPKIEGICDILNLQSLNKRWLGIVGERVHKNKDVNWSQLEKVCSRPTDICMVLHQSFQEFEGCEFCGWRIHDRRNTFNLGVEYFVHTHGGQVRESDETWPWRDALRFEQMLRKTNQIKNPNGFSFM